MKRRWIGTGPKVAKFEEEIGRYEGTKYAVGVNSWNQGTLINFLVIWEKMRGRLYKC